MNLRSPTNHSPNGQDATQNRLRTVQTNFPEDELLMLSGIQHIAFCERQYALAYIEMQWTENVYTIEGHHLHERVDDPLENESRKAIIILHAVSLVSHKLGLYGRADVVELKKSSNNEMNNTIKLKDKDGRWNVLPVEYKRGKPKSDKCDEVQLCAQAMCLEEMHGIFIPMGWLYYGETRHRYKVEFNNHMRNLVINYSIRMHKLFAKGITPLPVLKPQCRSCSLETICMPKAMVHKYSVSDYLKLTLDLE